MDYIKKSNDVYIAQNLNSWFGEREIVFLKNEAQRSPKGRSRICLHRNDSDLLQEMLIVMTRKTYIRPHKHIERSESLLILEGEAEILFFDDFGSIINRRVLSADLKKGEILVRISEPVFHTLIVKSEFLVVFESTTGPFRPEMTILAPWSSAEGTFNQFGVDVPGVNE